MRYFAIINLLLLSCGVPEHPSLPPLPDMSSIIQASLLGPGDVIEVRVYQEEGISGLYRIGADGTFAFPLVGEVLGKDKTPGQLGQLLIKRLKLGFIRDPQVSVFVKEFNSKKVFVLGEVRKPGTFAYEENMSIVQAVTLAGGLKSLAAGNRVILTRKVGSEEKKFLVPFTAIGGGAEPNVNLQPGDIIFVPESWL